MTFVLKKNKVKINQLAFNLYVPPNMKLKKRWPKKNPLVRNNKMARLTWLT